jgi:hypothetical protein
MIPGPQSPAIDFLVQKQANDIQVEGELVLGSAQNQKVCRQKEDRKNIPSG